MTKPRSCLHITIVVDRTRNLNMSKSFLSPHVRRFCYLLSSFFLQVLQRLPIEQMSSCDQLRCLFGLLSLTAYLTSCCKDEKMRTSPERQSHSEADVYQHEANYQNEAVLTSCLQLMMVVLEVSGTSSVYQLLEIHSSVEWLHRLSGLAVHL